MDIEDIEVFIGIDVGKTDHWATALSRDGQKVLDKALPNDEDRLREVYQRLQAKGQVLVVVDQPATIRGPGRVHDAASGGPSPPGPPQPT